MKERKTSLKVKKHIMIEKTKHKRHEISIKDFFFLSKKPFPDYFHEIKKERPMCHGNRNGEAINEEE